MEVICLATQMTATKCKWKDAGLVPESRILVLGTRIFFVSLCAFCSITRNLGCSFE